MHASLPLAKLRAGWQRRTANPVMWRFKSEGREHCCVIELWSATQGGSVHPRAGKAVLFAVSWSLAEHSLCVPAAVARDDWDLQCGGLSLCVTTCTCLNQCWTHSAACLLHTFIPSPEVAGSCQACLQALQYNSRPTRTTPDSQLHTQSKTGQLQAHYSRLAQCMLASTFNSHIYALKTAPKTLHTTSHLQSSPPSTTHTASLRAAASRCCHRLAHRLVLLPMRRLTGLAAVVS